MTRIELASIGSLTFYDGDTTRARRGKPIPQLTCRGKACALYKPDVVRCTNVGGSGTDVDWKCEAELPESLRLGRVEVSCEGWSGPGDSYVYKESCGLEYRLTEVPGALRNDSHGPFPYLRRVSASDIAFYLAFFGVLLFILYKLVQSCLNSPLSSSRPTARRPGTSPRGGYTPPGGYPGGGTDAPPPYTAYPKTTPGTSSSTQGGSDSGFWTGAALGGLGTYLLTRPRPQEPRAYDWERERYGYRPGYGANQAWAQPRRDDRGEGPSSLGSMRRSTGYGGSNVR